MMSYANSQTEDAILQMLVPNLEAEGFRVFVHPTRAILPPFMRGYQPDAIAVKQHKKVAIEVKLQSRQAKPQIERLQALFAAHPDWELRVVYAPAQGVEQSISTLPKSMVAESLDRLLGIFDQAGPVPALLTGWSVFEAAARRLLPDNLGRPQSPARLLEVLASDGSITPDEANALRTLGRLRNEAAHGRLDIALTREQVADLVRVTRSLLALPAEAVTPG